MTSRRLGSSFLDNPGWDSHWFHHPEAALPGFPSWDPVQAEFLKVPGKAVHQAALVAIELAEPSWILLAFGLFWHNAVYSAIENHKPRGIAGYDLGQNPGGGRYLLLSAFIGDQAV